MDRLSRSDILSLEEYEEQRSEIRERMVQHKRGRFLQLGPHASLQFEDQTTMKYQIQEMLRAEKIFDREGIQEELDTYNELIPSGSNWIATLFLEYPNLTQRQQELSRLVSIEERFFVQVSDRPAKSVHANDDMERSNAEKTSAIHFLRFEFSSEEIRGIRQGSDVKIGIDDERLPYQQVLPTGLIKELERDFD